jgi:uncharacterized damage-inducible protein DinB
MDRELIAELVEYNYWARDRQLEACAALTEEQFLRPLGGSFTCVRDTLAHLLGAEWIWLERWRGREQRALTPATEFPSLPALRARWKVVEAELRGYVASLSETQLASTLTYTNIRGEQHGYPLWRILLHLSQHQSYHRGQVTNQLRLLGAAPPRLDLLIAYDTCLRAARASSD